MTDYKNVVLGNVGDTPLTLDDILFQLKTNLEQQIVDDAVQSVMLRMVAKDLSIEISDAQLQAASDGFRRDAGLLSAAETVEWLEEHGLSTDEFEKKLEDDLLKEAIQAKVATPEAVGKLFAEQILEFEKAEISMIALNDAGLADEIKMQIDEGEAEFSELAARHSTDTDTAAKGGYMGFVKREDLPEKLDLLVFQDAPPKMAGPIEIDGTYHIVKIISPKKADLDDPVTQATCRQLIFEDYMTEKSDKLNVTVDFLSA